MSIVEITDHAARIRARVLSQFADSPNILAVLAVIAGEVQALETTAFDLVADRMLDTAVGAQQDQWGKIVGQPRGGLSDADYKVLLKVRIEANRSCGTGETIISVISKITGASVVHLRWGGIAHYEASYEIVTPISDSRIAVLDDVVLDATAAGVSVSITEEVADVSFRLDSATRGLDQGRLSRRV